MMEKKYQLVAWTRNITDKENARLYVVPSVELELIEPFINEVSECRRQEAEDGGHISLELARRFVRVYEQSARFEIFIGHIDEAIRFLLKAADCCMYDDCDYNWAYLDTDFGHYSFYSGKLRHEFVRLCEEAVSLARKYGLEHVLKEGWSILILKSYRDYARYVHDSKLDEMQHLKEVAAWK